MGVVQDDGVRETWALVRLAAPQPAPSLAAVQVLLPARRLAGLPVQLTPTRLR